MKISPSSIFSHSLQCVESIKPLLSVHSITPYLPLMLLSSISTQFSRRTVSWELQAEAWAEWHGGDTRGLWPQTALPPFPL